MTTAPDVRDSSAEERRSYIQDRFRCIADCDMCGLCTVFRGKDPETVYRAYILGTRSFEEVSREFRANRP